MNVLIIGAGQVGRSVAQALAEKHEVTVVDKDPDRLEQVRSTSDVSTVEGNGVRLSVLKSADVETANLVIGSTGDERINILICSTANALNGTAQTIARVSDTEYMATWSQLRDAFKVDTVVGANYLTARSIVDIVGLPMAQDVEFFASGRVQMAEFNVPSNGPLTGRLVEELNTSDLVNLLAIFEPMQNGQEEVEIVRGKTRLSADSRLLAVGKPDQLMRFAERLAPESRTHKTNRVMIFGGGEVGYQTARMLEDRDIKPRLVEKDPERAQFLARSLRGTLVFEDDALNPDFLRQEGVPDADLIVSTLTPDERGLLATVQAKDLGAKKTVSVVRNGLYQFVFEGAGTDVTVSPKQEVIEEILRYTRERRVEKITFFEHDQGEVVEVELNADSTLVARPLEKAMREMPNRMVVGAVVRDGSVLIPRGKTILKEGDHLVLFIDREVSDQVLELI
jgi:trk system potassium uptake protein TrkA